MKGIYHIKHVASGRVYVGSAKDCVVRRRDHWIALENDGHFNLRLQRAWNKYGHHAFEFIVVAEMSGASAIELIQAEALEIGNHKAHCFNINLNPCLSPMCGKKHTKRTRMKMSIAHMGKSHTEEAKRKLSIAFTGRLRTDEHKRRLSVVAMGRIHNAATKLKISKARIGMKFTEEHRRKMSTFRKGTKLTEETKLKLKDAWKRRKVA